jgi:hypothetical protein
MINILYATDHVTVEYAAKELKKYLDKVSGIFAFSKIKKVDSLPKKAGENEILLGYLSDFSLSVDEVEDPMLDDVVDVKITQGSGYIAGSNARSILFGIYDYFKSMGCLWVRPGPYGEHLVSCDPHTHDCTYHHKADVRFRGECLEGSPSYEHIRATIVFSPKVHMNLFMMENIVPYNYMSRWYRHTGSTYLPNEDIGFEGCKGLIERLEKDLEMVGLQFHALGHGYITAPWGVYHHISGEPYETPKEMDEAMALVNGKRGLYASSPFFTQFCMGNQDVMNTEVEWLIDYAKKKPYIDFLHVWLGDAVNGHCECPLCTPHHPSDLYVKMLNQLDERLTEAGLSTKIIFISYTDTMWAPKHEVIKNPKRFIFCTAINSAINKDYDSTIDTDIPKWERNKFPRGGVVFPKRHAMMLEWEKAFKGETFVYGYHNYTEHYNDPGAMDFCSWYYRQLHQVVEDLHFGGTMSDQTPRTAFPIALGTILTGEVQFDMKRSYEDIRDTYLKATYGEDFRSVIEYLEGLTKLFSPQSLRQDASADLYTYIENKDKRYYKNNPDATERFEKIAPFVDAYLPTIEAHLKESDPCHARSYKILWYHAEYCKLLAKVFIAGAKGDVDAEKAAYRTIMDRMSELEPALQYEFEIALFDQWISGKVK